MQRVLSREVTADDGVTYPEGTPVDALPAGNRESIIGTGWSKLISNSEPVEADEPAGETEPPPPDPSAAEASDQTEAAEPEAVADESPLMSSLGLSDDLVELLTAAGVLTVAQAKQYRQTNGSFRTIKGIGKVSDGLINSMIDQ